MNYDMIDRYLRNNLGDDDYAEYSAALDELAGVRKPLTDVQIANIAGSYSLPYSLTSFVRTIEAAHGITEVKP